MTDEQPQPRETDQGDPQHRAESPEDVAPWPPKWLRTMVVVVVVLAFLGHLAYDTVSDRYEGFQTTFLLLGFVGLSVGVNIFGRKS